MTRLPVEAVVAAVYLLGAVVASGPAAVELNRTEAEVSRQCSANHPPGADRKNCEFAGWPFPGIVVIKAVLWPCYLSYRIADAVTTK